jgi:hypothetical protein
MAAASGIVQKGLWPLLIELSGINMQTRLLHLPVCAFFRAARYGMKYRTAYLTKILNLQAVLCRLAYYIIQRSLASARTDTSYLRACMLDKK